MPRSTRGPRRRCGCRSRYGSMSLSRGLPERSSPRGTACAGYRNPRGCRWVPTSSREDETVPRGRLSKPVTSPAGGRRRRRWRGSPCAGTVLWAATILARLSLPVARHLTVRSVAVCGDHAKAPDLFGHRVERSEVAIGAADDQGTLG